jgi:hypothetical protein
MKKLSLLVTVLFLFLSSYSRTLSPQAEISLLTASPGDELYSVFGHSAIRVMDPVHSIDAVFNYGTFDFNTPNFYMQFVRGKLLYKLSVSSMEHFEADYYLEGRALYEQVINLSLSQKQQIFDFLLLNRLPENAYYHYDFFHDNCATRIRDLFDEIMEPRWADDQVLSSEIMGPIRTDLNYEFDYRPDTAPYRTFRDLLQPFLVTMPWSRFGIDLALGLPADKVAHPYNYMYLPDEMLVAFSRAQLNDGTPLVSEHRVILTKDVPLSPPGLITPLIVCWVIFLLALISYISPFFSKIFDRIFFTTLGIIGLLIVFLWFFTDHSTTKANLNILWALPTHLYFVWKARYLKNSYSVTLYFRMVSIVSFLLLALWPIIPQAFNESFFPIILVALVKSIAYSWRIPVLSDHLSGRRKQPHSEQFA